MRLTVHEGVERFPGISADGRWIAFTAQYEGNNDVYVMSMDGGEPRRLTVHPATDMTLGWTRDGRVLFRSTRDHPHGDDRIYRIDPEGGIPELIPLEPAAQISFEPRGRRVAMQKMGLEFHSWKRYKGGEAEQIEVGTLEPLSFEVVTEYDGKDAFPMWHEDGRIYFLSDRWGRPNLASMNPDGSDVRQLTTFDDYDVRWPSLGDGVIVYQHKMDIWTYDLATGRNGMVPIHLPSDRLQVRERFAKPLDHLASWGLSKDGQRIVLETRGDLFATRTRKKGLVRRVTESSLARTKSPAFSPDGRRIAAWTEVDGEEQLVLHSSDNSAAPQQLGETPPGWHFAPRWSPDGARLAWGDDEFQILVTDVETGKRTVVDRGGRFITEYAWSPDGRYLAYAAMLDNRFNQVRIWDSKSGKVHAISDPMYNTFSPAWDPHGKYLYFFSDRHINPYLDRFEYRFIVDEATLPFILALQADGTLPFATRGDTDPESDDEDESPDREKKKGDETIEPVRIDFEGLPDRIIQVPVEPGNYFGLSAVTGKLHWLSSSNRGMNPPQIDGGRPWRRRADLRTYDIEKEKLTTIASGVRGFDLSMDGEVLVYRTNEGFLRIEAGATSPLEGEALKEARIDLSGWSLTVNPRQEWRQMLREAWRLQRDFFYDPNMHGVDWDGVWEQYGSLADRLATRDDLNDIIGQMHGELNVSHASQYGGDVRRGRSIGTGLLAADLTYDDSTGFWRIEKIYRGEYPTPGWASPLARPDLRVQEGMWLVAIDGKPLRKGEHYLKRLGNRAGQEVELSINETPRLDAARRIVVKTVPNDRRIRYATWIREMRAYVDERSGGRIGYIHLYRSGGSRA
jgi:tricorn protease